MDVAGRDGVADAEEAEATVGIARDLLRLAGDQRVIVDFTAVARLRLQREVELVERQRAVLNHDLIHDAGLRALAVVASDHGGEAVAVAPHGEQAPVDGDAHAVLVEAFGIDDMVEAADLRREEALGRHDLQLRPGLRQQLGRLPVATMTMSGASARTSSASAHLPKRMSTPSFWSRCMRQSTIPWSSRRRCARAARRTCPPGCSAASNSTTAWPRSPATRAASRPAGPAPTTTILRR